MLVENVPVSETTSSPFFVATSVSNLRPLANAGSDLIARRGSLVRLSAASSKDPDAGPTPLSYSWVTLAPPAGIALNGDNSSQPTFQPSIAGRYTFGLTVHDGLLTSVMDTVLVTVPKLGDIDRDDDVDSDDLNLILAARNTPANGPNDLRDLNGDGKIDALDSRKLVTLCTRPRCATR